MEFSTATKKLGLLAGVLGITAIVLAACSFQTVKDKPADASSCAAQSGWFPHADTPATDDSAFASSSNCEFHQWAWQNFLWLTQMVDGEPRFMSFVSPDSLLGNAPARMMPRKAKSNSMQPFNELLQAGSDGIFVSHSGRAVYYSQYLNSTFIDFINDKNLTDPKSVRALIAENPDISYPIDGTVGSMELKASWRVVDDNEDTSDVFTTSAEIATLYNKDGKIMVSATDTETITLALVGLHIAGVVKNHPEMIWATFEHKKNSPVIPSGDNVNLDTVVSPDDFTFYTGGTTIGGCNLANSSSSGLVLDETTQTLSPITQACLQYEFGNSEGANTLNDNNVSALNSAVDEMIAAEDVFSNYREVGAIWFKGENSLKPGQSLATDELLTGSLSLSNSTIETFTQLASTKDNCFRCHNTQQEFPPSPGLDPLAPSNLNISHAFLNIYFRSQLKNLK